LVLINESMAVSNGTVAKRDGDSKVA